MLKNLMLLVAAAVLTLTATVGSASAKPVNWNDVWRGSHNVAYGYTVGIATCDPHAAAQGQGITFHHRSNAEALYGKLVKYGARRPGTYAELFLFHRNDVYATTKFACSGVGSGIHT